VDCIWFLIKHTAKPHLMFSAGEEAASMEKALGIRVVRHITKKPAGDAVDLEKHFRLASPVSLDIVWLTNRE
jgi:hypothetical protein